MNTREAAIRDRFNGWLGRYAPPRYIAGNAEAMQDEADDMLRIVLRWAPAEGYGEWMDTMLGRLAETMTTRSWPAPGEITRACRETTSERRGSGPAGDGHEDAIVDRLAEWFSRFGNEMPGFGSPARTAALIRRGVLENEREARFRCFRLNDEQERRAIAPGRSRTQGRHGRPAPPTKEWRGGGRCPHTAR